MIGLVVTGHGHFADGIHTSAQMIAGENEYVRYINFEEGMTPEQLAQKFNAAFDEFRTCDGVVVLSDLPGGSPFKTAVECKYARPDQKIEVIAGTNLPMIVTAVTMLDMEDDPRSLAEELVDTGKDCMVIFELQAPAEEAESDESDGIYTMINWEVILWTCVTLAVIMGVIGLILYAISAKNMRNKRKELGEVHTDMKVGSRIMFAGGIYGKIVSMEDEDTLRVEVAPKIVITISRYAVQSIVK